MKIEKILLDKSCPEFARLFRYNGSKRKMVRKRRNSELNKNGHSVEHSFRPLHSSKYPKKPHFVYHNKKLYGKKYTKLLYYKYVNVRFYISKKIR